MGRCPDFLNVDDFDALAHSIGYKLSDDGVSAIGEITEILAKALIQTAAQGNKSVLNFDDFVVAAHKLGLVLEIDRTVPKICTVRTSTQSTELHTV